MNLPKGFDIDLSLELANLSYDAYTQYYHFKKGDEWSGPEEYRLEVTLNAKYERELLPIGFIASKGHNIYISWRGTSTIEELGEDVKFSQVTCSYLHRSVKVELGFNQLYTVGSSESSPQAVILNYLKNNQVKGTVYVTGHSLGAAIAVLNTLDVAINTSHKKPVLYTFAGPRVGDPSYASLFNRTIFDSWRVVNSNDEVPKLPLKWIFGERYKHVNEEFDITLGNDFPWEWGKNHSLTNYIKQLKTLQTELV